MKMLFLHVGPDGTNTYYQSQPANIETIRVWHTRAYEFTSVIGFIDFDPDTDDRNKSILNVPMPVGSGWEPYDFHHRFRTMAWRRKRGGKA